VPSRRGRPVEGLQFQYLEETRKTLFTNLYTGIVLQNFDTHAVFYGHTGVLIERLTCPQLTSWSQAGVLQYRAGVRRKGMLRLIKVR